jgi:hypothetical protein
MKKQGQGIGDNNTDPHPGQLRAVKLVSTVFVQDMEKNLEPFPVRVNLWTTVKELKAKVCDNTGYPV